MAKPQSTDETGEGEASAPKTIQNVKNSLKYGAQEKGGILTVRLGVKKYILPTKVRLIANEGYLFLSFPASSEIYKMEGKGIVALGPDADVEAVRTALTKAPKKGGRRPRKKAEIDPKILEILAALPSGHRIGYNADGSPKVVKTRPRRTKKAE